jgi:hypothetical protein
MLVLGERWRREHLNQLCDIAVIGGFGVAGKTAIVTADFYEFSLFKRMHQDTWLVLSAISVVVGTVCGGWRQVLFFKAKQHCSEPYKSPPPPPPSSKS